MKVYFIVEEEGDESGVFSPREAAATTCRGRRENGK
jgi:hypothetical protein